MGERVIHQDVVVSQTARVLLVGQADPDQGSLVAQIESLGHPLRVATTPEEALLAVETDRPDLVIIDATAPNVDPYRAAATIKHITREQAVPVMFACLAGDLRAEISSRDLGADDCFARPVATDALGARIRLLLRNRHLELSLRQQHRESALLNQELLAARDHLDRELRLASQIQRSLLPASLPRLDRFQFAATLRSSDEVSGDFYDVYRLDETHWGFYVADAIGHGVPAALLTIFIKKGIQTRDLTPDGYRLLAPAEVLERLNRDLIMQKLSGNPFVTLFYAILDVVSATVTFASAGHPPAILLGADGAVRPLLSEGALLGIFESEFTTGCETLREGDRVVLYTDGIEQAHAHGRKGLDALLEYLRAHAEESREDFTRHVDGTLAALLADLTPDRHVDDTTVVVLRMLG